MLKIYDAVKSDPNVKLISFTIDPKRDDPKKLKLYADNLGLYPPNTGLLVVRDVDDIYNIRFSSDLQKSSGVLFRKKRN